MDIAWRMDHHFKDPVEFIERKKANVINKQQ
jgi:hypothetical protein